jgi:hypothetical protein
VLDAELDLQGPALTPNSATDLSQRGLGDLARPVPLERHLQLALAPAPDPGKTEIGRDRCQ